jgi:hypothetical protein
MDEVNVDEFLREVASVIDDPDKLAQYLREKATIAIERFLVRNWFVYIPVCIMFFLFVKVDVLMPRLKLPELFT